jgi:hypothetical protein
MKPSELLSKPERWCRYTLARTATGLPCGTFSALACQWDLTSAISRYTGLPVAQSERRLRATEVLSIWREDNRKAEHPCQEDVASFNDTTSHKWLLLALDQANL